jgi:hypothetical protein
MLYKYYSKSDSKKEPISLIEAYCLEDAIEIATQLKNLSVDKFLEIFEVIEYEYRKKKTP